MNSRGNRGYEGLSHHDRAAFSAYLQGMRERAGLSQDGLANQADSDDVPVDLKAVAYFEGHPANPLAHLRRRSQLTAICAKLAEWLGQDRDEIVLKVNRLGGGIG